MDESFGDVGWGFTLFRETVSVGFGFEDVESMFLFLVLGKIKKFFERKREDLDFHQTTTEVATQEKFYSFH